MTPSWRAEYIHEFVFEFRRLLQILPDLSELKEIMCYRIVGIGIVHDPIFAINTFHWFQKSAEQVLNKF